MPFGHSCRNQVPAWMSVALAPEPHLGWRPVRSGGRRHVDLETCPGHPANGGVQCRPQTLPLSVVRARLDLRPWAAQRRREWAVGLLRSVGFRRGARGTSSCVCEPSGNGYGMTLIQVGRKAAVAGAVFAVAAGVLAVVPAPAQAGQRASAPATARGVLAVAVPASGQANGINAVVIGDQVYYSNIPGACVYSSNSTDQLGIVNYTARKAEVYRDSGCQGSPVDVVSPDEAKNVSGKSVSLS